VLEKPLEGSGNLVGRGNRGFLEGKGRGKTWRVFERSNQDSLSTHLVHHAKKESNPRANFATY
jgi:hypothetical protein